MRKRKIDKAKIEFNTLKEHSDYQARKITDMSREINNLEHQLETYKLKINSYEGTESIANRTLRESVTNLMEIIRWNNNPKTAEFPFELEKGQRDEMNRGRGNFNCRPY
jgi:chromosome segregation ATPase